ncbi:DUF2274 domain-containing protein [Mesorhizobium sp.]|uniref:DUF2274 domain-containing protein n=1 Tax=Mesorhizobium sp. TaxID=1871066 RepID=UPI0012038228|nr:DUF2274 domain-containing protein [Mesorhizobium sp.]TIP08730.1 MAG: DUF2274 domain-containing protein [Mesorhizobium sp.]
MTRSKLSSIADDRPVTIRIELPAVHRDLVACADCLNGQHVRVSQAGDEPCRI